MTFVMSLLSLEHQNVSNRDLGEVGQGFYDPKPLEWWNARFYKGLHVCTLGCSKIGGHDPPAPDHHDQAPKKL